MAKLKVYSEIADKTTKTFYSWFDLDAVCFEDVQAFIDSIPEDDDKIDLYLHCPGGSCIEGFAMYDALRTSGKTITTIVDGMAASMATILMMAAPKERRFAQKNASICIHKPFYAGYYQYEDQAHVEDLEKMANKMRIQADELRDVEKKILDLYVERTGTDRETLEALMDDERFITTDKAIELGLIGDTLEYTTDNKNINNMNKVTVEASIFSKMLAKLGITKVEDFKANDMVITSADGTELTISRDEGDPAVGDEASPNGEFVMEDGSTIVIADGKITDIKPKEEEGDDDDDDDDDEKDAKIADLTSQIATLQASVTSLTAERDNLTKAQKTQEEIESLASIAGLNEQITNLTQERDALKASQKTADEVALLDKVNALGGMAWVEVAAKSSSKFVPEGSGFADHTTKVAGTSVSFESYIEDKKKEKKNATNI